MSEPTWSSHGPDVPKPPGESPSSGPASGSGQHDTSAPHPSPGGSRQRSGPRIGLAALLATSVWALANVALTLAVSGPPPSPRAAGAYLGALLIPFLVAALITWLIARRRPNGWPFWQLVVLALPVFLVVRFLLAAVSRA